MNVADIKKVAVIGAGLMGHGIAQEYALHGYDVWLNDISDELLERALKNMGNNLKTLHSLGLVPEEAVERVPRSIHTSISIGNTLENADFVIEAIAENLPLKRKVFAEMDRLSPARAILASNTSTFIPSQLAPATKTPERVLVAHYWNPPYLVPLVEVVRGPETSDEIVNTVVGLLRKVGKRPAVIKKEALGFIGNRLQIALMREAVSIVERGIADIEDVDLVVRSSLGRRLAVAGPFEVFDLGGLDIFRSIYSQLGTEIESSTRIPAMLDERVGRGDLGVKTGKGFHEWTPETIAELRQRVLNALATIEKISQKK